MISAIHKININETYYPEKYAGLVCRLVRAIAEPSVKK